MHASSRLQLAWLRRPIKAHCLFWGRHDLASACPCRSITFAESLRAVYPTTFFRLPSSCGACKAGHHCVDGRKRPFAGVCVSVNNVCCIAVAAVHGRSANHRLPPHSGHRGRQDWHYACDVFKPAEAHCLQPDLANALRPLLRLANRWCRSIPGRTHLLELDARRRFSLPSISIPTALTRGSGAASQVVQRRTKAVSKVVNSDIHILETNNAQENQNDDGAFPPNL